MLPPRCHLGSRTSDLEPRISDLGSRTSNLGPRTSNLEPRTSDLGPRVSDLGPRVSDLGPRTSNLGPDLGPRTSDLEPRTSNLEPRTSEPRTSDLEPRTSNLRDNLWWNQLFFWANQLFFFKRCFCVFPFLHGCWACWFTWVYVCVSIGSSLPRCCPHLASMLGLCWICHPWPWVLVGSMSMLDLLCWAYMWSMLDLLRCPQMCSKAGVGAIGFMLDVSHVGHIFLFFDFQGGVRLKGLNLGKADSRIFWNLVILVTLTIMAFTSNHRR